MTRGSQGRNMSDSKHTLHVALVGTTGVGKSTLVNLLTSGMNHREIADVHSDAKPCTLHAKEHVVKEGGTNYCIWDTRGLNEASEGVMTRALKFCRFLPDAERELKKLLRREKPRFDLVLLCIDRGKCRARNGWKIYNFLQAEICNLEEGPEVAVVVTRMKKTEYEGTTWKQSCKNASQGVVEHLSEGLMEAVPELDDPPNVAEEKKCKSRILTLISNACEVSLEYQ